MLPLWLSSWYQTQQAQSQEPFNDHYEAAADEEGDWVEVITPSIRNSSSKRRQPPTTTTLQQQQQQQKASDTVLAQQQAEVDNSSSSNNNNNNTIIDNESSSSASTTVTPSPSQQAAEPVVKGLSRQERRANARFAVKEKRKQARNAAMVLNRSRIGKAATSCLPSSPLSIDH